MGCGSFTLCRPVPEKAEGSQGTRPIRNYVPITHTNFIKENYGTLLSVYHVKRNMMSTVHGELLLCQHRESQQLRTVKVIKKDNIKSETIRAKLLKEINLLKTLTHPNTIQFFEYFEDSHAYYLVIEHCKGGTLKEALEKRSIFTEELTCDIINQLVSAISYLSDNHIKHKDVRVNNILIEDVKGMQIKLGGFGPITSFETDPEDISRYNIARTQAPEVIQQKQFSTKSDIWSIGVIMYMLISGEFPFKGNTYDELVDNIMNLRFSFKGQIWERITPYAKDILSKMLTSYQRRISIQEVVSNPWIHDNDFIPSNSDIEKAFNNMKNFYHQNALRNAVCTYIITHCLVPEDTSDLRRVFKSIDTNRDGKLSKQELIQMYSKYINDYQAEYVINTVMSEVDSDQNNYLDYTEFLKASLDPQIIFSRKNLQMAFDLFDKDHNGSITQTELRRVLGWEVGISEEIWQHIISEVDLNDDGEIDFEEFEALILSKI